MCLSELLVRSVAEHDVLPTLDGWLTGLFEPSELDRTVAAVWEAQPDDAVDPVAAGVARVVAECDAKLGRYRAALEAGTEPALVAAWTAQVQAERATAFEPGPGAGDQVADESGRDQGRRRRAGICSRRAGAGRSGGQGGGLPAARPATDLPARRTHTMRADIKIDAQSWG